MKKYVGMNFQKWCALDEEDERKINYTLIGVWNGKEHKEKFTSEDTIDGEIFHKICLSTIQEIYLKQNEWYVTLIY